MRIIEYLKNIIKDKKEDKQIILFNDIEKWISDKENQIKIKENDIFEVIKQNIIDFNKELNNNIKDLEQIDVDSKDANDRVKKIVKENLNKYISYAKKLDENLTNLEYNNFEKLITLINNIFINFEKNSLINYQRISFLFRKELIDIRKNIVRFSKDITEIFESNKEIIKEKRIINLIKNKLDEINNFKERKTDLNNRVDLLNLNRKEIETENINIKQKIKNNLISADYLKNIENINKKEKLETELKEKIIKLKEKIDFKNLSNIYHVDEKKLQIIKAYKEKFETNYLENNGKSILELLNNSKLITEEIELNIKQINQLIEEIEIIKKIIKKDENKELEMELNRNIQEIENITFEIENETKKIEKIEVYEAENYELIKEKCLKLNFILK